MFEKVSFIDKYLCFAVINSGLKEIILLYFDGISDFLKEIKLITFCGINNFFNEWI